MEKKHYIIITIILIIILIGIFYVYNNQKQEKTVEKRSPVILDGGDAKSNDYNQLSKSKPFLNFPNNPSLNQILSS